MDVFCARLLFIAGSCGGISEQREASSSDPGL